MLFQISSFAKEKTKKISVQLMWIDQYEFAGFYAAKELGIYKKFGLDVELRKFDPNINIVNEIGRASCRERV